MKNLFKLGGFLIAFMLFSTTTQAQKYGYMNFDAIVSLMPEMKSVQTTLETTQKQYQDRGQKMIEELQAEFQAAQTKMAQGILSPKQQEEEQKRLEAKQGEIAKYEQEMMAALQKKEFEALAPVREKMKTAIDAVAAEGGYTFIFNYPTAANTILFADSAADVTDAVAKKLGVTLPAAPVGGGK